LKLVLLAILSCYSLCCSDSFRDRACFSDFGYVLRIRAWVCLRKLALASGEYGSASGVLFGRSGSIANAGMRDIFGIVELSGKQGEKRKYCKVRREELEAGGGVGKCLFSFS